jgi:hypothetical protein
MLLPGTGEEWPATGATVADRKVQLRYRTKLTFEEYARTEGWRDATLECCPVCPGAPRHVERLGKYLRKRPAPAYVTRYVCRATGTTIGLLPDFYASRTSGLLADIEEGAAQAETASSREAAAGALRPAEAEHAVTLPSALRWLRRRIRWVVATLATVRGLLPERFEKLECTVASFRAGLGVPCALVALRGICEPYLHSLPAPLGLVPPPRVVPTTRKRPPQSSGPAPPPKNA